MPPYFYKRKRVTGEASKEKTEDILTSTEAEPKHVNGVYFLERTATEQNDAIIRVYIERDKIAELDCMIFNNAHDANAGPVPRYIELEQDLDVGETLTVGHLSGSTLSTFEFLVKYEIRA